MIQGLTFKYYDKLTAPCKRFFKNEHYYLHIGLPVNLARFCTVVLNAKQTLVRYFNALQTWARGKTVVILYKLELTEPDFRRTCDQTQPLVVLYLLTSARCLHSIYVWVLRTCSNRLVAINWRAIDYFIDYTVHVIYLTRFRKEPFMSLVSILSVKIRNFFGGREVWFTSHAFASIEI